MLGFGAFWVAQLRKNPPAVLEIQVQSPDQEDPMEKKMATLSSILAWKIWSLVGYSPRGCKELDLTERLILSLSLQLEEL